MLTEFVLVTMIWSKHQFIPLTAEVFPSMAACQRVIVDKSRHYCVPLIRTVDQSTANQTTIEQKTREKK